MTCTRAATAARYVLMTEMLPLRCHMMSLVHPSLSIWVCLQDVAIKILRNVQDDSQQYQEFLQVGGMSINN